jgi:hypothetical protein
MALETAQALERAAQAALEKARARQRAEQQVQGAEQVQVKE